MSLSIAGSDSSPGPRDSLERLRTLTRLNRLVSSSLDQQKVLEEIARAAAVLTSARVVVFWLADESTRTLRLEASWREPGIAAFPVKRLTFEDAGAIGWIATNRRPLNVADVFGDRRFIAREWWRAHALRSFLAFPIAYDGALLAVLGLNGSTPFVLDADDENLLESFLAQATVAIRNAQAYADARRREREAKALAEIGRLLASTLDPATVGREIAVRVRDLFGAVSASVRLLDADGGLTRLAWSGQASELPSVLTNPPGIGLGGRAVAERKVVWSRDTLNDPTVVLDAPLRERMVQRGGSAGLAAPFVTKGRIVGALTITDQLGRVYSDDEQALAQAFADQASLALENARLFTTERTQRERAEILGEVTRDLLADLDSSRILRRIVEALAHMFAAGVGLFFVEGESLLVERVTSINSTAPVTRLRFGEGLSGECAQRRTGVLVNDYPRWPQANPLFVDAGVRHAMAQPLIVGDELLGVLTLRRIGDAPPSFSHDDLATLQTFAEHTALVLRNVSVYEAAEHRRREAEALTQVARLLTETLDPMTVGARIVEHVLTMFPDCVSAGVTVPDAESTQVMLASGGRLTEHFPIGQKPKGLGLADRVARERRVISISDLLAETPVAEPEVAARYRAMGEIGVRAAVGIPLRARDRIVGVLRISFGEPRVLTEAEIALGQAFADQAALALENARLYEEAERRRREAEVLAKIAGNIGAFLDVDTILRQVTEGARLLVRSDMARIALHDPESRSWRFRHWVNARHLDYEAARLQPAAGSLGGLVLQTGRPARTNDRLNDPRFPRNRSLVAEAEGVVAQMAVPIRIGGEIEGLLFVDSRVPRNFSDADEAALMRLAEHAAIAIHDAQLFDERQRAQAALQESEKLYRLLAENATDVISVFGLDFALTYVSPSVFRLRGYTPEEVLAQPLDERLTPASRDLVARTVEEGLVRAASGMAAAPFRLLELEQLCKGGGTVWTEATVTALRDGADRRIGYLAVARDISERKRTEAALREREEELRQAQKMEAVGRLAGGIAHDFNNLLTVIGGRIEIALDNPTLPAGLRRDLEVVYRTAETAALLTRQLLAFGRKQMLQPRRIDLNAVIGGLLPMLQRLIGEDVEVEFRRPSAATWVEADPGQIEQVILNLTVNARDAMTQGGRLTLGASTMDRVDGSYVMLTVSDTGIGMDEATRSRIFEPFFTTKPVGKGTGMGLATVFGIVKQSGGDILVASEPGRGTRFEIYLPRVDAPAAAHPTERRAPAAGGTETVLVVEDEPELRSLVREALQRQGYVVLEAARPSEALRVAEEHAGPIPLLVTDVVMPEMKGPQLARLLRPRHPEMRVLYMSGYADLPEGTPGGDAPLLQKPFRASALVEKVREILDSGRVR